MRTSKVLAALTGAAVALAVATPTAAIVNGYAVPEGDLRFVAAITDADEFQFCGGSVIASDWVLTAAHCVLGEDPAALRVITGRTDLANEETGQVHEVIGVVVHPEYLTDDNYDAALLQLADTTSAPRIQLAGERDDVLEAAGTPVTVAGWGDQTGTLGLTSTNQLRATDLEVVGDAECADTNGLVFSFDPATSVCAADLLEDSCQGDSGGPLWAHRKGRPVQLGVVSYGLGCGTPEFPGVYTEVNNRSIRHFIRTVAGA